MYEVLRVRRYPTLAAVWAQLTEHTRCCKEHEHARDIYATQIYLHDKPQDQDHDRTLI